MKRTLFAGAIAALAVSSEAFADQRPFPCNRDGDIRVGCFNYRAGEVYKIWSAPQASLTVQLEDGEVFGAGTGADVCGPKAEEKDPDHEKCSISVAPWGSFLVLKFWRCVIKSPVQVVTKAPDGKPRMYAFEVHTEPEICVEPDAKPHDAGSGIKFVGGANAAEQTEIAGNLKYVGRSALTVSAKVPVLYSATFHYPDTERKKARETAREKRAREDKERVEQLLDQEVNFATHDPWRGDRNYQYKYRGSNLLRPSWVWDNDYSTAMVFPAMQTVPEVYRVITPEGYACKDDDPPIEQEQLADARMRNETMIITGTSKVWRLRAGLEVIDICDLNYNPIGQTPGTGTASRWVRRIVKGASE